MSRRLDVKELHNIRDLGGEITKEGKRIIPGKLIRSGKLEKVPEEEISRMENMVGTVIDFRSDGEHAREPDVIIPGVEYHHLPIVETQAPGITREGEADIDLFGKLILHLMKQGSFHKVSSAACYPRTVCITFSNATKN